MNKDNNDDWLFFSQSYLQIAKLACQELIEPKHNKRDNDNTFWKYCVEDLIIPIIYNTKHGIEIFIKTINLIINNKYDEGHDIHKLFDGLKQKIEKLNLRPRTIGDDKITQEMIDDFPKHVDETEQLVKEFYEVRLLKPRIKDDFVVCDVKNDIFRYPENKALVRINWREVWSRFNIDEIKELKIKVEKLYDLLNDIGYFITILLKPNVQ
ncbi:MAG: hypothetical protein NTX55_01060 [Candidatus Parcubacteria bacterium]|nr:hypothetical protein [Candidatus Parcubacteria bacterium]